MVCAWNLDPWFRRAGSCIPAHVAASAANASDNNAMHAKPSKHIRLALRPSSVLKPFLTVRTFFVLIEIDRQLFGGSRKPSAR